MDHDLNNSLKELFQYVDKGNLPYLSAVFAQHVLEAGYGKPHHLFLLAYVHASSMKGNSCSIINQELLTPSLEELVDGAKHDETLTNLIKEGSLDLPENILLKQNLNEIRPLAQENDAFYLHKDYFVETHIIKHLHALTSTAPSIAFSAKSVQKMIDTHASTLNEDQQNALLTIFSHGLTLLTGGPGTGKSYTIALLVKCYLELCLELGLSSHVTLMAPTGKACGRLKEALHSILTESADCVKIGTLHSSLSLYKERDYHRSHFFLGSDLVIIDECSMIDTRMWYAVLSAIQKGSRVVLIGDPHQLPPVEKGFLFQEMVSLGDRGKIPRAHLQKCLRSDRKQLLELAHLMLIAEPKVCLDFLGEAQEEVSFTSCEKALNPFLIDTSLKNYFLEPAFNVHAKEEPLIESLKTHEALKLLSSLKQGPWGIHQLNIMCFNEQLRHQQHAGWMAFPIMITKNDSDKGLYNGDMGFLITYFDSAKKLHHESQYAVFFSSHSSLKKVPASFLPSYEYAYAISIHKSQGSEFPQVIMFLPEGSEHFGREILYTGITRAKRSLKIYSQKNVLELCLQNAFSNVSYFTERFIENEAHLLQKKIHEN